MSTEDRAGSVTPERGANADPSRVLRHLRANGGGATVDELAVSLADERRADGGELEPERVRRTLVRSVLPTLAASGQVRFGRGRDRVALTAGGDRASPAPASDGASTAGERPGGVDRRSAGVAAATGAFVLVGGVADVAPLICAALALVGVGWLFVEASRPAHARDESTTVRGVAATGRESEASGDAGASAVVDPARTDGSVETDAPTLAGAPNPTSTDQRITRLIGDRGGRMMQKEIVGALDLSRSAVSRRLSKLEEEESLGRVCLGRENLVYLPGCRPDGLEPPLELE